MACGSYLWLLVKVNDGKIRITHKVTPESILMLQKGKIDSMTTLHTVNEPEPRVMVDWNYWIEVHIFIEKLMPMEKKLYPTQIKVESVRNGCSCHLPWPEVKIRPTCHVTNLYVFMVSHVNISAFSHDVPCKNCYIPDQTFQKLQDQRTCMVKFCSVL